MKLKEFKFEVFNWPPPENEQYENLFGWDEQYQPYLLRRETIGGQYWCGTTLETSVTSSASPKYVTAREVEQRIKWWAEAPLMRVTISKNSG